MNKISVLTDLNEDLNDIIPLLYLMKNFNDGSIHLVLNHATDEKIRFIKIAAALCNIKKMDVVALKYKEGESGRFANVMNDYSNYASEIRVFFDMDEQKFGKTIVCFTIISLLKNYAKYINDNEIEIIYDSKIKIHHQELQKINVPQEKILQEFKKVLLMPLNVTKQLVLTNHYKEMMHKSSNAIGSFVEKICSALELKFDGSVNIHSLASALYLFFGNDYDIYSLKLSGQQNKGTYPEIDVARHIHKVELLMNYVFEALCENKQISSNLISLTIPGRYIFNKNKISQFSDLFVEEIGWEKRLPGSSFGPCRRKYFILHLVESGKGKLKVDNQIYDLKTKDVFLLPNDKESFYESEEEDPITYYWIGFSGRNARSLLEKSGLLVDGNYVIPSPSFKTMQNIMKYLVNLNINTPNINMLYLGNLYLLLYSLISNEEEVLIKTDTIERAKEYIDSNYMNHITIHDVANFVNYERTYLFRKFKEKYGISPDKYLTKVKMEKAKELLDKGVKPIEVSSLLGFNDYQTFFVSFRKYYHCTPTGLLKRDEKK